MATLRQQLERLRDDVRTLVSDKEANIDPLRLAAELDRIINSSDKSNEHLWRKYERRMELWKEQKLEMSRAVFSFGQGAIRSLILINGGAAVAVMTFIGNFENWQSGALDTFASSLRYFAFGVVAAALVAGFAYVTQFFYEKSSGKLEKTGIFFHVVSVLSAIISIALFVFGLLAAYQGFLLNN